MPRLSYIRSPSVWCGIFTGCMLLQTMVYSIPDPYYLVLFPAELHSLSSAKVCAHIFRVRQPVTLVITLQVNMINQTLVSNNVKTSIYFRCYTFQVPLITKQDGIVANVSVWIKDEWKKVIFQNEKQIYIRSPDSGTIIQTDKPVYKGGEKVWCRIITLNSNLIPQKDEYPSVVIQDSKRNRIAQWQNLLPHKGIAEFSLQLVPEALLGDYTIHIVKKKGADVYQTFTVDRYDHTEFKLEIKTPIAVTILDTEFSFSVCGRKMYTYPVKGAVQATVCRTKYTHWYQISDFASNKICLEFSGQTNHNGCYSTAVQTGSLHLDHLGFLMQINVTAFFEEAGTGVKHYSTATVPVSQKIVNLEFQNVENYYRPGINFNGKIVLQKSDKTTISNQTIYLSYQTSKMASNEAYMTDENGAVFFSLITTSWTGALNLRAYCLPLENQYFTNHLKAEYGDANLYIEEVYSSSRSYVILQHLDQELKCGTTRKLWVDYFLFSKELQYMETIDIFYLVITRGNMIENRKFKVPVEKTVDAKGSFPILLKVRPALAPTAHVLVYVLLPVGKAVAASHKFKVSKCFKNKAELKISNSKVLPGSTLSLSISASKKSLCALQAVDKNILLKPAVKLTAELVYRTLPAQDLSGYPFQVEEYEPSPCYQMGKSFTAHVQSSFDTFNVFKRAGLKLITNYKMKKPVACPPPHVKELFASGSNDLEEARTEKLNFLSQPSYPSKVDRKKLHKYCPKSWLWQLESVGAEGKTVSITVPEAITEWEISMFCTEDTGFGLADTVSVITFKPFIMELSVPSSVVLGEKFTLNLRVYSYLRDCIMVSISLTDSRDFRSFPYNNQQYISCLCVNEEKNFSWTITPVSLGVVDIEVSAEAIQTEELCGRTIPVVPDAGKVDHVIKSILVEPEGVLVELSKSNFLYANGISDKEHIVLQLPADAVSGSATAEVFVTGDIIANAMQSLQLLATSNRFGEENILALSVAISKLRYLNMTGQLKNYVRETGVMFLQSGYQRQLSYRHDDCSFSAFGSEDESGSLWLTAFTVSQLSKASEFTFIDYNVIECAVQWLSQHQLGNGCFKNTGKLYQTSMKNSVDDDISLSAYICYLLQELSYHTSKIDSMISCCLNCLRNKLLRVKSLYGMALLANVFRNPEDAPYQQLLLNQLDQLATKQDGLIHWTTQQISMPSSSSYWELAPSGQVELAGYVMLAYLSKPHLSQTEMKYVSAISQWIVKQHGAYSGSGITQDTVIGFDALAKYSSVKTSGILQATVTVYSKKEVVDRFHVNYSNRLLFQLITLRNIPGNYTIKVTGSGFIFVQQILEYNIHPKRSNDAFSIHVMTDPQTCTELSQLSFIIIIFVSYLGSRNATNLAIIEVKMLSGFCPDDSSLEQLKQQTLVKKINIVDTSIIIYVEHVSQQKPMQYTFAVKQNVAVRNQQPAAAKIYDYYKPEENSVTEYNSPCREGV